VRVLRYELRRFLAARSTWWITGLGLLLNLLAGLVAAVLPDNAVTVAEARRAVAAWAPALPLPVAAVCTGLLGAVAFRNEQLHSQLLPALSPLHRRLRLVGAKLAVLSCWSVGFAAICLIVNLQCVGAVLGAGPLADPARLLGPGAPRPALGLAVAAVAAAWLGLLGAGLFRRTAGGVLLVAAGPMVAEPALRLLLDRPVAERFAGVAEYLPFTLGRGWSFGALPEALPAAVAAVGVPGGAAALAPLLPAVLLLLVYGCVLTRRRSL
jgi:hypothetical protein